MAQAVADTSLEPTHFWDCPFDLSALALPQEAGEHVRDDQTRLWACKIAAVRSGDCRAGQMLTIQLARSRNFSMAGQPTTSQILKLTSQIDAASSPET